MCLETPYNTGLSSLKKIEFVSHILYVKSFFFLASSTKILSLQGLHHLSKLCYIKKAIAHSLPFYSICFTDFQSSVIIYIQYFRRTPYKTLPFDSGKFYCPSQTSNVSLDITTYLQFATESRANEIWRKKSNCYQGLR